jgi:dihydrofolate reductase
MKFSIIVAADLNNGIGFQNNIPWSIPNELKYFQDVTVGEGNNVVIMGRKTWDSLPDKSKPLKNRTNIVVTRNQDLKLPKGVLKTDSLHAALVEAAKTDPAEVFVIGGAQLYEDAIKHPACSKIYLTRIQEEFDCDTFFPELDPNKFEQTDASEPVHVNGFSYQYQVWEKEEQLEQ